MFQNNSATINDKHTFYHYGLYVTNTNPVASPTAKMHYIEIPGKNGKLDITDALTGYVIYGNRIITLKLGGKKEVSQWPAFLSEVMSDLHGKRVKVIFDDDMGYYYVGRATVVPDYDRKGQIGTFTVTIDAEPYKYSIVDSLEPWKWDTFSFVDGVIQGYSDIVVNGSREVTLSGSELPVIPEFIANSNMTVTFEGKQYNLSKGTNKIYDIVLLNQDYPVTFTGNGTVSVSYRKGRL